MMRPPVFYLRSQSKAGLGAQLGAALGLRGQTIAWGSTIALGLMAVPLGETGRSQASPLAPPLPPAESLPLQPPENGGAALDSADPDPADPDPGTRPRVELTLTELLELTLSGNRALRNDLLGRIVERQELAAAEQQFDPLFTPILRAEVQQDFSGGLIPTDDSGTPGTNGTALDGGVGLGGEVRTRQGTEIRLTVDALDAITPLAVAITQPLLRGFGEAVNEAPVEQARLAEAQNQLVLRETVTTTVTTAIGQYTALAQAEQTVVIREQALARRREELRRLEALVAAGRRAGADLFDAQLSVANGERDLVVAQNALVQANAALLTLVGTNQDIQFSASPAALEALYATAVAQVPTYDRAALVELAYQRRPDYLRSQLNGQRLALSLLQAEDDLRWDLNATLNGEVGDFSQSTLALEARRTFDQPEAETTLVRSEIALQQQANDLAQLEENIRNDVLTDLAAVRSALAQVTAAEQATENARRRLEASRERFERVGDISLFELTEQEDALVNAQNAELAARVDFLNSTAALEETVGITVERWATQLDLSALATEMDPLPNPAVEPPSEPPSEPDELPSP